MGSAALEFADVIKFRFGAPVIASDGPSGMVSHVLMDPDGRLVTQVGIKLTRFGGHPYNVPVELVSDAHARAVTLAIARADIPQKAVAPSSDLVRWDGATTVAVGGKLFGRLAQLTVRRDTSALRHLVVDRGMSGGEVVVPGNAADGITAQRITLTLIEAQIKNLVSYRPDGELEREASEALYNYPRLRVDMRGFQVRAIDGTVYLRGHISSDLNSRIAADQLVGLAGLYEVRNDLIADTDLAAVVASALAGDPRTHGQHIGIYPDLGTIFLRGAVETAAARAAAETVTASVPGVDQVRNELSVRPGLGVVPVLSAVTSRDEEVPGGG